MESNRIANDLIHKKPKVVFDNRFGFTKNIEIGERGQLDVLMTVHDLNMVRDPDNNNIKELILIINTAEKIEVKDATRS